MVRQLWQLLLEDPSKLICDECSAVLAYYSELLAVPLALSIREAVVEVEGTNRQEIEVVGYIKAEELNGRFRELESE
jgi:hypothetical protein